MNKKSSPKVVVRSELKEILDKSHMSGDSIPALGTIKSAFSEKIKRFFTDQSEVWHQTVAATYPYKLARLVHHRYNMRKRWYIVFYAWDVSTEKLERYRMFEPLNRIKDKHKRIDEANELIKNINAQLRAGKVLGKDKLTENVTTSRPEKLSLLQAIKYVSEQKELNGHRRQYYRSFTTLQTNLEAWLEWKKVPDFPVKDFNESDAREFFTYLRDEKSLANKTINGYMENFGIALRFIEKQADKTIWRKDPLRNITSLPVVSKMHAAYSDEQIKKIWEEIAATRLRARVKYKPCYDQLELFIGFIYYAFARPNELFEMRIADIQINENRVYIPGEASKNKMDGMVEIAPRLKELIISSGVLAYPQNYLVFGQWGKPSQKRLNNNTFWDRHKEILKRSGLKEINENFSLYSYKHSGVIKLYLETKDMKLLQRLCRHQTLEQTNEYLRDLGVMTEYNQLTEYKGAV